MKGTVRVLLCDGQPDSTGHTFKAEGLTIPNGEVPVVLEFAESDLAAFVGKAKLRLDSGVLLADLSLLDSRMQDPARAVLYPIPVLVKVDGKGNQVLKAEVRYVGLSIARHADHRIGTLFAQGVKP